MPRPHLAPGTYGEIACQQVGPAKYKARARFRDADGVTRTVSKFGQTKSAAKEALRAVLAERTRHGRIESDTTVRQLAALWLEEVDRSERAARTKEHYHYLVDRYVLPGMGALRVSEASTRVVDQALQTVARQTRAGARSTRAVLNGMFGLAVRHGAIPINPVRETRPVTGQRSLARALTVDEAKRLCDQLRTMPRAVASAPDDPDGVGLDLADLVDFMLMTGCRVGEALACRVGPNPDGNPLLDLNAGTWEINATVVRIKGKGLMVQERPKSDASHRIVALPASAVFMLSARLEQSRQRPDTVRVLTDRGAVLERDGLTMMFPSPFSPTLRDPSNLAADLRVVLDGIGFDWVTSHTFRKTVATRLSDAGWPANAIADQLGHAQPSMTQDVYVGRRVVNPAAAKLLER